MGHGSRFISFIQNSIRVLKTATIADVALTCRMKFPKMDEDFFYRNHPER